MFKKVLFVLLLAAAVVAFAGYSVPTASACSTSVVDDCRPIFGSAFDAIQPVPSGATLAPATSTTYYLGEWHSAAAGYDLLSSIEQLPQ